MNHKGWQRIASVTFVCILVLIVVKAPAQDHPSSYTHMAPLGRYLMTDQRAEIALAQSAAPDAISRDAKVLVLTRHGYKTVAQGKNGFVCVVERSWMAPFDSAEFWNPKIRGPVCFNPPAARSILPMTFKRTELILAGKSKDQVVASLKATSDRRELPPLEPGAMSYMMSKQAYLTDEGHHNVAHLMFYAPLTDAKAWGADLPNSPVMLNPQFKGVQPIDVFVVPVGRWSDGTSAPVM
jgi:hypothetical protein